MKKGYTLVELIAVLFIISLISTLALVSITKQSTNSKKMSSSKFEELMYSSAKSYLSQNTDLKDLVRSGNLVAVSYSTLESLGYIDKDMIDLQTYKTIDIEELCVCVGYSVKDEYKYTYEIMKVDKCK